MKKFCISFALIFICINSINYINCEVSFDVKSSSKKYSKLKNMILCHGGDKLLRSISKIVAEDLDFTDQFEVVLKSTNKYNLSKSALSKLFEDGFSLVTIFNKKNKNIKVEIRDTSSGETLFNKSLRYKKFINKFVNAGHRLSSDILDTMTGDRGVCLSSLAYCKTLSPGHKVVCISDYAVRDSKVVIDTKTVNLAPRWHSVAPVLFYSQLTRSNNRLMSVDLRNNKKKIVCSYSGLNMQPAFSPDGSKAVLCLSGGMGNSELYFYNRALCSKVGRRVFSKITSNGAHNVSPSILPNGDIIFCSDFQTGLPQIYYFETKSGRIIRLTNGKGYAAAPCYSQKNNSVAYVRPVRGVFQAFMLNIPDNISRCSGITERQLTMCHGSKHEPSWSPCGRYLAFSIDRKYREHKRNIKKVSQIGIMNIYSRRIRVVTRGSKNKTFPVFSPKLSFLDK